MKKLLLLLAMCMSMNSYAERIETVYRGQNTCNQYGCLKFHWEYMYQRVQSCNLSTGVCRMVTQRVGMQIMDPGIERSYPVVVVRDGYWRR
jgi:hypothetical protein